MKTGKGATDKFAWTLLVAGAALDTISITIIKAHFNIIGEINTGSIQALAGYALKFSEFPIAVIAVILLTISPILPFIAISRIQLSLGYPVLAALHLLFVQISGYLLLHEPIEANKAGGVICILISIYFFHKDSLSAREPAI